jgi:hypothetical protein
MLKCQRCRKSNQKTRRPEDQKTRRPEDQKGAVFLRIFISVIINPLPPKGGTILVSLIAGDGLKTAEEEHFSLNRNFHLDAYVSDIEKVIRRPEDQKGSVFLRKIYLFDNQPPAP